MTDDLHRFVAAQAQTYADALAEIRAGAKRSHWMWFIFPQIAGLGRSTMAQHYAIASLDEARAYLAHPLLGARLRECVSALNSLETTTAERVFGTIDAMKLRSSLTLFEAAGADFGGTIDRWFGDRDSQTLALLQNTSR
ncbi:calpastatin [Novosphingobium barchaimii]|nr:calpastatin [Novosphingobium barchaimii]